MMRIFQELYDGMLRRREQEKVINPIIMRQVDKLGIQIYAINPLQFNIMYGDITQREKTKQEYDIKFETHGNGKKEWFKVVIPSVDKKKEFQLNEEIEKLAVEFSDAPHVQEIVDCLLNFSQDDL